MFQIVYKYIDYMKYIELNKILEKEGLYIFSIDDLSKLSNIPKTILKQEVYYWKGKGWLRAIKKGLYELVYPKEFVVSDLYIANKLYVPSYVSLETALSHYSIIPEIAMGVTSVTTKPTREFRNFHGYFRYRSISPKAYLGYGIIEVQNKFVKIASPEKAFVDYIYFNIIDKTKIDIEELRIDREKLKSLSRKKICGYAGLFTKKTLLTIEELYAQL